MSKSNLSAQMTTRLVRSFRRGVELAREAREAGNVARARTYEAMCLGVLSALHNGGRPDIASDLFAESLALVQALRSL